MFDVKRFAIHDGPGVRTAVFFKGCPMRCAWCHNPESQAPGPELLTWSERCAACGACVDECPSEAISQAGTGAQPSTDRARCTGCGACVRVCGFRARAIVGAARRVLDLATEAERDRLFYEESGGGVTLSGGEPLGQPDAAAALLRECRRRRIHTAIDTCGVADPDVVEAIAQEADLFLYDVKLLDDERHRQWTGVSNAGILGNLARLAKRGSRVWLRYPLVPGVNDSARDLAALGKLAARVRGVEGVQLLPYHAGGERKAAHLGRAYALPGLRVPDRDAAERAAAAVCGAAGVAVTIGG